MNIIMALSQNFQFHNFQEGIINGISLLLFMLVSFSIALMTGIIIGEILEDFLKSFAVKIMIISGMVISYIVVLAVMILKD